MQLQITAFLFHTMYVVRQYRACVVDLLGLEIIVGSTVLHLQAIPILSAPFFCQRYIPLSNLKNFYLINMHVIASYSSCNANVTL